jgi:hypothetical protein
MNEDFSKIRKDLGRLIRKVQIMEIEVIRSNAAIEENARTICALRARIDALEGNADFDRRAALIKSLRPEFRVYRDAGDGAEMAQTGGA